MRSLGRRPRDWLQFSPDALIARGKTDFEISVILAVSEHTVHNTVRRAMRKYGVATRVQAFVRALRDGELNMEDVAHGIARARACDLVKRRKRASFARDTK